MKTIPTPAHAIVIGAVIALATITPAFAAQPTSADATALASANNAFACDLYAQLKDTQGNLFFSPFSVSSALAMAYAGANGDTAAQMRKALRFPDGQAQENKNVHASFAELLKHFDDVQRDGSVQLSIANSLQHANFAELLEHFDDVQLAIANSLWPQKDEKAPLRESYLALVKQNYGVEITPVDFAHDESKARTQINWWVTQKTRGKIQNLIASPLFPPTRLVLVSAVYFKGAWGKKFNSGETKVKPFHTWSAPDLQVPLMHQSNLCLYGKQADAEFIELPYQGENISMLVILPADKTEEGLAQIEKQLSPEKIAQWRSQMTKQEEMDVYLPRFTIDWRAESLVEPLKKLGMPDAFVYGKADFSGMNGNKELFINDILQKAFVDVNEEGTEAAAATNVYVTWGIRLFRADHPFLFLIQDNATGSILFMGRVVNPAAQ